MDSRNQYECWQNKDKCLKLQSKFGKYGDFERNRDGNEIIANRQIIYYLMKDLLKPHYTLLEVGPGPGQFLWALKDYVSELHGLEYSKHMIELCKEQFKNTSKEVNLIQGTCWELPYPDNNFDVSLQVDVTRHVGGCWASILEQIRVSKKYVIFSGPSFENFEDNTSSEYEIKPLAYAINIKFINKELDTMIRDNLILDYYYVDRPNKKNGMERKVLVIQI